MMWILKMTSVVLLVLVLVPGVWSNQWRVNLYRLPSCLVTGSSVEFQCSYYYPTGQTVTTTTWYKGGYKEGSWNPTARTLPPDRVKYLGDKIRDCRIKISGLQESDTGKYYFRFETNWNRWTSQDSVYLSVKNVTAKVDPTTVNEGGWVSLRCETCPLNTPYQILWFRDGQLVSNSWVRASREVAGSYTCAVKGQETIRSDPVVLDVRYGPKKVILSVSPPGEVVRGSSVTLTCSSDANPAVPEQDYRLFKSGQSYSAVTRSKRVHTISNIQPSDSGQYSCQARNTITSAWSTLVQLDVQYPPTSVNVSAEPVGPIGAGSSVTLTCSSDANPEVNVYSWYSSNESMSGLRVVGSNSPLSLGPVLQLDNVSPRHSGWYVCVGRNTHGFNISSTEFLNVTYPPGSVSVKRSPSASLVEGSSVNLTCSSEANPAVDSYTWYRRTGPPSSSSLVGSGQVLSLDPSQTGHYLCQARNSLGETNSTLVELEIEGDLDIYHRLILRVLIGVKLLAVFILPFVMLWARSQSPSVR